MNVEIIRPVNEKQVLKFVHNKVNYLEKLVQIAHLHLLKSYIIHIYTLISHPVFSMSLTIFSQISIPSKSQSENDILIVKCLSQVYCSQIYKHFFLTLFLLPTTITKEQK